jgi:hypothetical protein
MAPPGKTTENFLVVNDGPITTIALHRGFKGAAFQRMSLVGAPRNGIATRPSRDRYRNGINRSVIKSLAGVSYGLLR